ncbi:ABC transporter F family member 4-like isoform X2 [Gigantopelta aegis]|uniref:ABC transporter F family member 4-like isoform X2 n=1 Tax=Gigantopelta aegis TaxID=1735272 RepID=UPI001B887539|nr:ABC transporter F family member 4-like isoform X2 [Gigantopelta aegis]
MEMSRDAPYGADLETQKDMDTDSNITGPAATSSRIDIRPNAGVKKSKGKPESDRKSVTSSSSTRGQARKTKKQPPGSQQKRRRTPSTEGDRKSIKSNASNQRVAGRTRSITSISSQKKRNISAERGGKTPSIKSKKEDKALSIKSVQSKTSVKDVPGNTKSSIDVGESKKHAVEEPMINVKVEKTAENEGVDDEPETVKIEDTPKVKLEDEPKAELDSTHDESFASSTMSKYSDEKDTTGKEETEELLEVAPAFKPPVSESDEVEDEEEESEGEESETTKEEIPKPKEETEAETEAGTEAETAEEEAEEEVDEKKLELEHEEKDQPTKEPVTVKTQKHVTTIVEPQRSSRMSSRMSRGSEYSSSLRNRRGLYDASRTSTRTSSRPRTTTTMDSPDGRTKQKEFFKEELRRLEESLKREKSKIHRPPIKKYIPYTFNNLDPYFNVHAAKYLIELPEEVRHVYTSRSTALGLCDPVQDYRMDHWAKGMEKLPHVSKPINRHHEMMKKEKKIKERESRHKTHEGSTRLPKFPVVTMKTDDLVTKQLFYSDVPMLRRELEEKYSANAQSKIDEDFKRTQEDFYRMELDRMDEYHPSNRPLMCQAYFAYLSNTPGSRKAINDIMREYKKSAKA